MEFNPEISVEVEGISGGGATNTDQRPEKLVCDFHEMMLELKKEYSLFKESLMSKLDVKNKLK